MKMTLFSKLEDFKWIAQKQILQWWAVLFFFSYTYTYIIFFSYTYLSYLF